LHAATGPSSSQRWTAELESVTQALRDAGGGENLTFGAGAQQSRIT
jgi:hypothetical protein